MKQFAFTTHIWLGRHGKAFRSLSHVRLTLQVNRYVRRFKHYIGTSFFRRCFLLFSSQSLTRMRAARRCPSPGAPRTRPSSTAPSAPPTWSAPPPQPQPPRPAAPPPRPTRAQRRPSLSLQGADRPKLPERRPGGKGLPLILSLDTAVLILFMFGPFCSLLAMQTFSLELMKTK